MKRCNLKGEYVLACFLFLIFANVPLVTAASGVVVIPLSGDRGKALWDGGWSTDTEYRVGDVVYVDGGNYQCISAHTSSTSVTHLDPSFWRLVAGNANIVDTSSGDATADNLLSGKKAWVDGVEITGTYVCPPGQINCSGQCVDSMNNPVYCGDCVTTCESGVLCSNGQCHGIPGAACTDHTDCNSGKCSTGGVCLEDSKFVFVSSVNYNGDRGGVLGAHATCQSLADSAGLPGYYKAWLSDTTYSPFTTFVRSLLPYVNVDGVTVAADWNALTSTGLEVPLDIDENGTSRNVNVWTGTTVSGTAQTTLSVYTCGDWRNTTNNSYPGNSNSISEEWTTNALFKSCSELKAMYCFEQ